MVALASADSHLNCPVVRLLIPALKWRCEGEFFKFAASEAVFRPLPGLDQLQALVWNSTGFVVVHPHHQGLEVLLLLKGQAGCHPLYAQHEVLSILGLDGHRATEPCLGAQQAGRNAQLGRVLGPEKVRGF